MWMREYNNSGKGRVEFTGFDMQTPTLAIEIVRDFVAKTDVDYAPALARASKMALALNPSMAANVRWILDQSKGAGIVLQLTIGT